MLTAIGSPSGAIRSTEIVSPGIHPISSRISLTASLVNDITTACSPTGSLSSVSILFLFIIWCQDDFCKPAFLLISLPYEGQWQFDFFCVTQPHLRRKRAGLAVIITRRNLFLFVNYNKSN